MEELVYQQLNETVYQETLDNGLKVFLLSKPEMRKPSGFSQPIMGLSIKPLHLSAGMKR